MKISKLNVVVCCFLAVMVGINFTSCKQVQIPEVRENPTVIENLTLEQNTMPEEFIDHIQLIETPDSISHHYIAIGIGISPVAYKLDKQNPATVNFIQLIKDTEESSIIKPLKVTVYESESGLYITKVMKVSEAEEKEWRESPRGNLTLEQNTMSEEFIDYIQLFETLDSIPHYYVTMGMGAFAYKLDKQNPTTADFIQLIKDAEEGIKPLKVIIDELESGIYITKVMKVSEAEEKEWRESPRGKFYNENVEIIPKQ